MTKLFCDRCKKETLPPHMRNVKVTAHTDSRCVMESAEICYECILQFYDWLKEANPK